jgi:hypothetical protein
MREKENDRERQRERKRSESKSEFGNERERESEREKERESERARERRGKTQNTEHISPLAASKPIELNFIEGKCQRKQYQRLQKAYTNKNARPQRT